MTIFHFSQKLKICMNIVFAYSMLCAYVFPSTSWDMTFIIPTDMRDKENKCTSQSASGGRGIKMQVVHCPT